MTTRIAVSNIQNRWSDGQRVDQADMTTEQNRNVNTDAAIVNNHFGSGVLLNALTQNIIFDSDDLLPDQVALVASGDFDGIGIAARSQPTDTVLGNQLEVELSDSISDGYGYNGPSGVFGRLCTKVLIIGLDFNGVPQYDSLTFYKKEKQVTAKHYTRILSLFFNDFRGNHNCSRHLGGRITIKEASSFQLSRDSIMISQDQQPNLFFRDFKTSSDSMTLSQTLQAGMGPEYTVDSLNLTTTVSRNLSLAIGDVTTKIGQKFKAVTNNLQKVTILLGVYKNGTDPATMFNWSGELIVSVYALQSSVSCPTSIMPQLAIEFDPNVTPITQFSIDYDVMKDRGYILDDVLQPVDFVFSDSSLGNALNPVITTGKYYMFVINRVGDASVGEIFTGVGLNQDTNGRLSIYNSIWSDSPQETLWYQAWTDAAKMADGQGYDAGNGVILEKTITNDVGTIVDYSFGKKEIVNNAQNTLNIAVVQAVNTPSQEAQDERTGNPIYSRQQFEPSLSFLTSTQVETLQESGDPLMIGSARDRNPKKNTVITGTQKVPGLVQGNKYIWINPAPDGLLGQNLIGTKLVPNDSCSGAEYRIFKAVLCTDGYGDVNGDGVIDATDLALANSMLFESIYYTSTQTKIANGTIDVMQFLRADVNGDGYIDANDINEISNYIYRTSNTFSAGTSFTHLEVYVQSPTGRFDGYYDCDGYLKIDGYSNNIIDPADLDPYTLLYDGYQYVVNMNNDPAFQQVPFVPIAWRVRPIPFWTDYQIIIENGTRLVPCSFTYKTEDKRSLECVNTSATSSCEEVIETASSYDPGRNDFLVPNNLIIGEGSIINKDGTMFKHDLEINTITMELPDLSQFVGSTLNVFDKLIRDSGDGFTPAGYPAMRFSDCTTVKNNALLNKQVRFSVAIQSIYPNLDGYSDLDGYGIIVDNIIGVNIDQDSGVLTLSMKDIASDNVHSNLRTKIIITVYLKKGGWNNTPLTISKGEIVGLFGL